MGRSPSRRRHRRRESRSPGRKRRRSRSRSRSSRSGPRDRRLRINKPSGSTFGSKPTDDTPAPPVMPMLTIEGQAPSTGLLWMSCSRCHGSGKSPYGDECWTCGGSGREPVTSKANKELSRALSYAGIYLTKKLCCEIVHVELLLASNNSLFNAIKLRTDANVKVERKPADQPQELAISGAPESVETAIKMIGDFCSSHGAPLPAQPSTVQETSGGSLLGDFDDPSLKVPPKLVGLFNGKGGENMKLMRDAVNGDVCISVIPDASDPNGEHTVQITGVPKSCEVVKELAKKKIREIKQFHEQSSKAQREFEEKERMMMELIAQSERHTQAPPVQAQMPMVPGQLGTQAKARGLRPLCPVSGQSPAGGFAQTVMPKMMAGKGSGKLGQKGHMMQLSG